MGLTIVIVGLINLICYMVTALSNSLIPSMVSGLFPSDYQQARELFLKTAELAGCQTTSWPIQAKGARGEKLAVDVARWGYPSLTHWLLITSGIHGTEGPFGTAVQRGFLEMLAQMDDQPVGVLFLHALNPYGYSWTRRANENNVDLNRNFLLPGELFQGAHPLYRHVYESFDPHRRRRIYDNFYLQAWWLIARHSKAALQSSLPVGQYDYPLGLFFGGHGPEQSQNHLKEHLRHWIPSALEITHLDFHTGLGRWSDYRLLIDVQETHPDAEWFLTWADNDKIECISNTRIAYQARGSFGPWMKNVLFPDITYRYAAAEFGTYNAVRVLHALVKELQTHYSCEPHHPRYRRAKQLVRETFVPESRYWRKTVTTIGVDLCHQSLKALVRRQ